MEYNKNAQKRFQDACSNGDIELVKQLHKQSAKYKKHKIDINANNNNAFTEACWRGHLAVAKLLREMTFADNKEIDINHFCAFAFRMSCLYSRKEVVDWLCTLDDNYIILDYNDDGDYNDRGIKYRFKSFNMNFLDMFMDCCATPTIDERIQACYEDIPNNGDIKVCPKCLSDKEPYHIKYNCDHTICVKCFIKINDIHSGHRVISEKCHHNCDNDITFDNIGPIKYA